VVEMNVGKEYKFNRVNGLTTITGYVLFDEPNWVTVKESDLKTPIILNKTYIASYMEMEAHE
jgi:hypothetical protein